MGTQVRKIKSSSIIVKAEKPDDMMDEMKADAAMGLVENILPALKPMIAKASDKLEEYFGDNEKIFMVRRIGGKKPQVVVLSNLKGSYNISNKVTVDGEGENEELSIEEVFSATKSAVIDVYDTGVFVEKLLNGEFTAKK